ncbi:hypothetical protein PLICRDRAFT_172005 [Plicaturopsis crispa FD-325 SS-3]|nr:hypothetical protein PLICRDRAFT_172005 [Plicaturopsis crispa FD-325 SS-3]
MTVGTCKQTPPPDDPAYASTSTKAPSKIRPWFPVSAPSAQAIDTSYQSGGIPTFDTSQYGGLGAAEEAEGQINQWETRYGMRVDMLAAWAYVLGPVTALAVLIIETKNDFVRFHAYQSALLTTPIVVIRILVSLLSFPQWIRTLFTILVFLPAWYMAFHAHRDANKNGLARYQLPKIGPIAEEWVQEE